jgi:hypothetical protein
MRISRRVIQKVALLALGIAAFFRASFGRSGSREWSSAAQPQVNSSPRVAEGVAFDPLPDNSAGPRKAAVLQIFSAKFGSSKSLMEFPCRRFVSLELILARPIEWRYECDPYS